MKIDWLEGTIKGQSTEAALSELHNLFSGWQDLQRGGLGYECSAMVLESGRVFWSQVRGDMGVHFSLPASALDNLGMDSLTMASKLTQLGCKYTRSDLALDDTKGMLNLETIVASVKASTYVCSAKRKPIHYIDYDNEGQTLYFGRGASETIVRVYDKAAEQNQKKGLVCSVLWIRVEMQLRGDRANVAMSYILSHPDTWQEQARGWLLRFLDFKIPGNDSNKSRWSTAAWWSNFLCDAAKARIFLPRKEQTLEKLVKWVSGSVSPSLAILQTVYGSQCLVDLARGGAARLKEKHLAMIDGAMQEQQKFESLNTGGRRETV